MLLEVSAGSVIEEPPTIPSISWSSVARRPRTHPPSARAHLLLSPSQNSPGSTMPLPHTGVLQVHWSGRPPGTQYWPWAHVVGLPPPYPKPGSHCSVGSFIPSPQIAPQSEDDAQACPWLAVFAAQ